MGEWKVERGEGSGNWIEKVWQALDIVSQMCDPTQVHIYVPSLMVVPLGKEPRCELSTRTTEISVYLLWPSQYTVLTGLE